MAKNTRIIDAILIDSFKGALIGLRVSSTFDTRWHELLDCHTIECVRYELAGYGLHGLFVDESGFLRDPHVYPQFKLTGANGEQPMAGYALLTALSVPAAAGEEIKSCRIPDTELAQLVHFENWQHRLKPYDYLDQLTRLYLPWP